MLKALEVNTIIDIDNVKRDLRRDGGSEPTNVSKQHQSWTFLSDNEKHKVSE